MSDPTTPNVGLAVPTRGSDPGTWDVPINNNSSASDGYFGGVQVISATNAPITLTAPAAIVTPSGGPTQAQNAVLRFTGSLTVGVQVTLPLPGYIIVTNLTTGNFVLSFRALGVGRVIAIEQGVTQHIINDGVNVDFVNLPTVGAYLDVCDAVVPAWITNCTVPPYLLCDGSTFNATTYPYLNVKLGGNTLPDFRGRSNFFLGMGTNRLTVAGAGIDGETRFASGGNNGINLTVNNIPTLTSTGVNTISLTSVANFVQGLTTTTTPGGSFTIQIPAGQAQVVTTGSPTITVKYTNNALATVQNAAPGIVGGIRLIRAA